MSDSTDGAVTGRGHGTTWEFNLGAGVAAWIGEAAPDPWTLHSLRDARSRSGHGHVPRWGFSVTVERHLRLESGLEHDLLRELDLRPDVTWVVEQPARLRFMDPPRRRPRSHIPDLLSIAADGAVTVWDVRPADEQDEKFQVAAAVTEKECQAFGWRYEVFSGLAPIRRSNLLWLDAYRRSMPWYSAALSAADFAQSGFTLGAAITADRGSGHVLSAVWHGLRTGELQCDLDQPLTASTVVMCAAGNIDE